MAGIKLLNTVESYVDGDGDNKAAMDEARQIAAGTAPQENSLFNTATTMVEDTISNPIAWAYYGTPLLGPIGSVATPFLAEWYDADSTSKSMDGVIKKNEQFRDYVALNRGSLEDKGWSFLSLFGGNSSADGKDGSQKEVTIEDSKAVLKVKFPDIFHALYPSEEIQTREWAQVGIGYAIGGPFMGLAASVAGDGLMRTAMGTPDNQQAVLAALETIGKNPRSDIEAELRQLNDKLLLGIDLQEEEFVQGTSTMVAMNDPTGMPVGYDQLDPTQMDPSQLGIMQRPPMPQMPARRPVQQGMPRRPATAVA